MTEARELEKAVNAAATLKAGLLAITDDADTLRDTIEGSTNLHEAIRATLVSIDEDEVLKAGLEDRIGNLSARLARIKDRIETKTALIEQAMTMGEIKSKEFDIATLSLVQRPRKVIITTEADIPSVYWKPQPPELDKAALKAALKLGLVPGAALDNGFVSLTISRR